MNDGLSALTTNLPGADIVDKILLGSVGWSELFEKHDFFSKYRYYLQVIASTGNPDLQIKWCVFFNTCVFCLLVMGEKCHEGPEL